MAPSVRHEQGTLIFLSFKAVLYQLFYPSEEMACQQVYGVSTSCFNDNLRDFTGKHCWKLRFLVLKLKRILMVT